MNDSSEGENGPGSSLNNSIIDNENDCSNEVVADKDASSDNSNVVSQDDTNDPPLQSRSRSNSPEETPPQSPTNDDLIEKDSVARSPSAERGSPREQETPSTPVVVRDSSRSPSLRRSRSRSISPTQEGKNSRTNSVSRSPSVTRSRSRSQSRSVSPARSRQSRSRSSSVSSVVSRASVHSSGSSVSRSGRRRSSSRSNRSSSRSVSPSNQQKGSGRKRIHSGSSSRSGGSSVGSVKSSKSKQKKKSKIDDVVRNAFGGSSSSSGSSGSEGSDDTKQNDERGKRRTKKKKHSRSNRSGSATSTGSSSASNIRSDTDEVVKGSSAAEGGEGEEGKSVIGASGVGGESIITHDDDDDSDPGIDDGTSGDASSNIRLSGATDFDLMMERKKSERGRVRRKKDIDLINDNDDCIAKMIADMRLAAREDRDLNLQKLPATKKISMLAVVMAQLNKSDLQMAFVEANVLSVLTDWLAPMPDKSLPSKEIRKSILKFLSVVHIDDHSRLKESGIGKAVMYLYKHPRELREHKDLAGRIINAWARPIFNLSTDFKSISQEDRLLMRQSQLNGGDTDSNRTKEEMDRKRRHRERLRKQQQEKEEEESDLRPGDPGWCYRARVPRHETSTYTNRPEWETHVDISTSKSKDAGGHAAMAKFEKHHRQIVDGRKNGVKRAVEMSIEGRKLAL